MTAQDYQAPESIGRLQRGALAVGLIALIVCAVGAYFSPPEDFYRSYLIGFLLVLGLSLGSLGVLMLHHLTSGLWGIVIRRPLEAATRTLLLVFLFFIPIIPGMKYLYAEWLDPAKVAAKPLSDFQRTIWLIKDRFIIRAFIYFAVWFLLVLAFNSWSKTQDERTEDRALRWRLKFLAGPGIILYVFLVSFAAIDWVMSISPHWASTIYGFLFVVGQVISSLSLMIAIVVLLARTGPFERILKPRQLHDLGNLLLAFVMLWAYFAFSQLLIIWSGNQPEEISFYRTRLYGGWGAVAVIVLVFHFFVPFFLLLSSDIKRNTKLLPKLAIWMIFIRVVDLFWMTRPEFTSRAWPGLLDFAAPVALLGLWLFYFSWQLKKMPLLPLGEPKLAEVVSNHEH
jgi:hypothetical protein